MKLLTDLLNNIDQGVSRLSKDREPPIQALGVRPVSSHPLRAERPRPVNVGVAVSQ